jgi:hypothetical protein
MAKNHLTVIDNGLIRPWTGRVWLNPPYGDQTVRWMQRMSEHKNGIALIYVRTETRIFFPWVWDYAAGFLFLDKRLHFYTVEGVKGGSAGCPSVLIAYSDYDADILAACASSGRIGGKFLMNEQVKGI